MLNAVPESNKFHARVLICGAILMDGQPCLFFYAVCDICGLSGTRIIAIDEVFSP